jgi:hypothetical protein
MVSAPSDRGMPKTELDDGRSGRESCFSPQVGRSHRSRCQVTHSHASVSAAVFDNL